MALGLGSGMVQAQSTVGAVYGTGDAGAKVELLNLGSGQVRTTTIGSDGKFALSALQLGDYKVTVTENGQVQTRNITVIAGQGTNVNLAQTTSATVSAQQLGTVEVKANALPPIDVSTPQTSTVLTSEQLKQLPIAKNQTAVALLTPGATRGDSAFGNLASFSGASVAENSYYVNGFNITNYYQSLTYAQIPFEAIDQESIQDGGYGAEYGNSTGGVISVQTKRGTNEWKGGVDVTFNPSTLQAKQPNVYLKNGNLSQVNSKNVNSLMANNNTNSATDFSSRWNAWIGGPLIKDKLFMFALLGGTNTNSNSYGGYFNNGGDSSVTQPGYTHLAEKQPTWLVKLDWDINDSNILEYTGFDNTTKYNYYDYNYGFKADNTPYKSDYLGKVYDKAGGSSNLFKYTSYITDDLTVSAQWGRTINNRINTALTANGELETYDGKVPDFANAQGCPNISDQRTPVTNGVATPYPNCSFAGTLGIPGGKDTTSQERIDFEYKIGDHDLTAGWGRTHFTTVNGADYEGGAEYQYSSIPASILGHDPTIAPGDNVVRQIFFATGANLALTQKYYYLQDNWHVTDNFLARIGVRNDGFENQNGLGQTYIKQVHSWQPRLGFSWDVHGDSSLKIYGSAGDYSLPLDAEVALRGASASLYGYQYYSYTGVDPTTGRPLGLGALSPAYAAAFPDRVGPVYYNGETGVTPNPGASATKNLSPFKQREFILGAQQQLDNWTLGVKAIYRKVLNGTDDDCDVRPIYAYANAHYGTNLPTDALSSADPNIPGGCFIYNPGRAVTLNFPLDDSGKLYPIHLSAAQIGEPKYKRSYESLEFTAERNFENKFYVKASYVWAKERGNTEGLVDSNIGQADTGTSELFDYPELMQGTNGYPPNDRRNTFKLYGAWQITPEWLVGANGIFQTGRPENCYGLNPIDNTIAGGGYGSGAYLYCDGEIIKQGHAGRTPNYWNIDLNVAYKPEYVKGLTVSASVFNVFNKERPYSVNETGEDANGASLAGSTYLVPTSFQTPRYVQLTAEYDFSL